MEQTKENTNLDTKDTTEEETVETTTTEETKEEIVKETQEETVEETKDKDVEETKEEKNNIEELIAKAVEKALEKEKINSIKEKNKIILESALREKGLPETMVDKFSFSENDTKETIRNKVEDYIKEINEVSKLLNNKVIIPDTGVDPSKNKKQNFLETYLNF